QFECVAQIFKTSKLFILMVTRVTKTSLSRVVRWPFDLHLSEVPMKAAHNSILLFGREPEVLATRQWVLESRGYGVAVAHSLSDIATVPKDTPIRLALLCYTLSPADRTAAAALTSTRWPGAICRALTQATRVPSGILGRLMHTC